MQNRFGLLDTGVMPMFMIIALDIIITMHYSINCSAVICSPTVIHATMREATSETYAPQVYSHHINLYRFIYLLCFLLCLLLFTLHLSI